MISDVLVVSGFLEVRVYIYECRVLGRVKYCGYYRIGSKFGGWVMFEDCCVNQDYYIWVLTGVDSMNNPVFIGVVDG